MPSSARMRLWIDGIIARQGPRQDVATILEIARRGIASQQEVIAYIRRTVDLRQADAIDLAPRSAIAASGTKMSGKPDTPGAVTAADLEITAVPTRR